MARIVLVENENDPKFEYYGKKNDYFGEI